MIRQLLSAIPLELSCEVGDLSFKLLIRLQLSLEGSVNSAFFLARWSFSDRGRLLALLRLGLLLRLLFSLLLVMLARRTLRLLSYYRGIVYYTYGFSNFLWIRIMLTFITALAAIGSLLCLLTLFYSIGLNLSAFLNSCFRVVLFLLRLLLVLLTTFFRLSLVDIVHQIINILVIHLLTIIHDDWLLWLHSLHFSHGLLCRSRSCCFRCLGRRR